MIADAAVARADPPTHLVTRRVLARPTATWMLTMRSRRGLVHELGRPPDQTMAIYTMATPSSRSCDARSNRTCLRYVTVRGSRPTANRRSTGAPQGAHEKFQLANQAYHHLSSEPVAGDPQGQQSLIYGPAQRTRGTTATEKQARLSLFRSDLGYRPPCLHLYGSGGCTLSGKRFARSRRPGWQRCIAGVSRNPTKHARSPTRGCPTICEHERAADNRCGEQASDQPPAENTRRRHAE